MGVGNRDVMQAKGTISKMAPFASFRVRLIARRYISTKPQGSAVARSRSNATWTHHHEKSPRATWPVCRLHRQCGLSRVAGIPKALRDRAGRSGRFPPPAPRHRRIRRRLHLSRALLPSGFSASITRARSPSPTRAPRREAASHETGNHSVRVNRSARCSRRAQPVVAAVACWVPAPRAARVDPAIALSAE